jgi:diketogulonate reductase-like aldo/keto reductase
MQQRPFGPSAVPVAVVGEGTWNMERDDRKEAIAAIRHALDLGATHIDTAEMYGQGQVERLVGEAIAGRRSEAFLVSKVLPTNASRRGTIGACERSLKRLGTDHLDCYLLHWPGNHPLEETMQAFAELEQAGKIRSYGVSNFDESELRRAVRIAGKGRIAQTRCSTTWASAASSTRSFPIARKRASPSSRTARSAPEILLRGVERRANPGGARERQRRHASPGRARVLTRQSHVFAIPKLHAAPT